ncbi:MAG TPA: VWA domain-containing protein [Candidatus Aminicenantes bacterium]|nr:VWA domain-containing protein [Candidatus Aminicenantes bacterium]HEB35436.1 VWA domain-containing protein [Candidatus Aminicenantes bacterium]
MLKGNLVIRICIYFFLFSQLIFIEPLLPQTKKTADKQESLQYEVTVTLKLIHVYVTDKKGKPVTDLTQSDFELYDNRKPVEITEFEKHILTLPEKKAQEIKPAPRPETPSRMNRKFFLFFDFAFNSTQGILKSKKAALYFIDTQLHPTDEISVISYSARKGLTLHEYLTTDYQKVRQIVEGLGLRNVFGRAERLEDVTSGSIEQVSPKDLNLNKSSGLTGGWDKRMERNIRIAEKRAYKHDVSRFCSEIINFARSLIYIPGYKHIILFSKGVADFILYGRRLPEGMLDSKEDRYGSVLLRTIYERMTKELAASNSAVYAVNVEGPKLRISPGSRDMMGDSSLRQLSKTTGGKYFSNSMDYKKAIEQIQRVTSNYYVLGYYIDKKWDGKYHKIKVKVKRKGYIVSGQRGYFNPKPFTEYTETEKLLHLIDLALSDRPHFQEPLHFPLITLPYSIQEKSKLLLLTEIPAEKIKEIAGKKVEIVTLIFDNQNEIVKFNRDEVTSSKFAKGNVFYYATSSLSPGEYDCKIVIRDLETGKGAVASSSVFISEAPESGVILYPPLLLVPEKNASYLKELSTKKNEEQGKSTNLFDIYPFDPNQYSPLVKELNKGISKLLAVMRYTIIDIREPEFHLSASLTKPSSGLKIPLSFSTLPTKKKEEISILLIEFQTPELQPGKYFLNLTVEELKTKSKSQISSEIQVR